MLSLKFKEYENSNKTAFQMMNFETTMEKFDT